MAVAEQPTTQQIAATQEAAFRRVAIVLSGLPTHVSSRLMGSLAAETKQRLREEIRNLTDVDPLERRRAYQAFKGSVMEHHKMPQEHVSHSGDTFVSSSARSSDRSAATQPVYRVDDAGDFASMPPSRGVFHRDSTHRTTAGNPPRPEMTFLGDIEDDVLARVIAGEHPQAIAFVLASIAPAQAARIVPTLDPKMQSEALNRIARLDEASEEVIADFAEHLRAKVQRFGTRSYMYGGTTGGKHALQAILDAMPKTKESDQAESQHTSHTHERSPSLSVHADIRIDHERASMVDEVLAPRIAPETLRESKAEMDSDDAFGSPEPSAHQLASTNENSFESTDAIHQHLIKLKPQDLCRVLAEVETRQALLTLCGLPNNVVENVLSTLPRSQAKQVRTKLSTLGSLQLREIDEAKELVATMSIAGNSGNTKNVPDPQSTSTRVPSEMPIAA